MTTSTVPGPAPVLPSPDSARPAHRDPNVLRWLAAYTASMTGDNVYWLALSWAAVRQGTPAQAGLVTAVGAVPRLLLMLGGGVAADRFGLRRIVVGSDAVRCVAVLTVAVLLCVARPGLWLLAVLAVVFGAVDAVFTPAVGALPPRIAARGQLARVQGMRGLGVRLAGVLGAPLGGLGIALGGAAAAFGAAAALAAVSVPLLLAVRIGPVPDGGDGGAGGRGLRDGLRYVVRHPVLAPLLACLGLGELGFAGPANVGITLLAGERGWGAFGLGCTVAAFGAGAGAGALLLAVRGRMPRAGLAVPCALVAGAAALAALAFVQGLLQAVGAALLCGLTMGLGGALGGALVQTGSDPGFLGRVTAVSGLISLGVAPLTMPLTGLAVGVWGTGPVFVVSAGVSAAGGVLGFCSRRLRRAELPG